MRQPARQSAVSRTPSASRSDSRHTTYTHNHQSPLLLIFYSLDFTCKHEYAVSLYIYCTLLRPRGSPRARETQTESGKRNQESRGPGPRSRPSIRTPPVFEHAAWGSAQRAARLHHHAPQGPLGLAPHALSALSAERPPRKLRPYHKAQHMHGSV